MVLQATLGKRRADKFIKDEECRRQKQRRTATEGTREKRKAYWKKYTQREEVKANRKRRNDAYYAAHREEYLEKRRMQKRAQRAVRVAGTPL